MLGYMVRRLDFVLFGTVATPSNDAFHAATGPNVWHDFANHVIACAISDRCLLFCVRIHVTISGTSIFTNASATRVRLCFRGVQICHM